MTSQIKHSQLSTNEIAKAVFVVNRHAKVAPDPRHLYTLKKQAIQKLLDEKKAKKIGLHFSENPKKSQQHSTLLVQIGEFYFHIPPEKSDFKNNKHLGHLDQTYRNPKVIMSLSKAKRILYQYLNIKPEDLNSYQSSHSPYSQTSTTFSPWKPLYSSERKRFRKK